MIFRFVFVIGLLTLSASGQVINRGQSRLIFHEVKELSRHWSLRGWLIGNIAGRESSNLNLLGGVGYQRKHWWLEAMVQRQWRKDGGQWFADFRFAAQPKPRWNVYLEAAPFLDKNTWYTTAFVQRGIGKGFSVGAETENVNGIGANILAFGPRLNKTLPVYRRFQPETAISWYAASNQPKVLRFYLVVHRRDKR